jgi:hypothetical protein
MFIFRDINNGLCILRHLFPIHYMSNQIYLSVHLRKSPSLCIWCSNLFKHKSIFASCSLKWFVEICKRIYSKIGVVEEIYFVGKNIVGDVRFTFTMMICSVHDVECS